IGNTVLKRRIDGTEVLSDYLDDGEVLVESNRKVVTTPSTSPEEPVEVVSEETQEPPIEASTLTTVDGTNTVGADVSTEPPVVEALAPGDPAVPIAAEAPTEEQTLTTVDGVNTVGADVVSESEEEPATEEGSEENPEPTTPAPTTS